MGIGEEVFKVMGYGSSQAATYGRGNFVNSMAHEPLNRFEQRLNQLHIIVGRRSDVVLKVTGSKVKITETFADLRFVVKDPLAGLYLSDFHWGGGQSFDWRLATIAGMAVAKLVPRNSLLN